MMEKYGVEDRIALMQKELEDVLAKLDEKISEEGVHTHLVQRKKDLESSIQRLKSQAQK